MHKPESAYTRNSYTRKVRKPENLYTRKCISPKFSYIGRYTKIHSFHSNEASKCTYGRVPPYHNNLYIVRRDHVDLPSSLGRPLDRCMSTSIALWFLTYIDDIKVQVDLFIVFRVQVDVSIVLGIQVDRNIDYGV